MSSGMFRGKESSNRIKLSQLVQELLNFGVFSSLWLWGWGVGFGWMGVDGGWGCLPTHAHTCACMCTHARMHAHACMVNMIISCKWLPPLGKSLGIPYDVICTHVCACVWGQVSHHPHPHPPTPTSQGDPWNQSKFNSTWTNWDISILKIWNLWRLPHPWVGV